MKFKLRFKRGMIFLYIDLQGEGWFTAFSRTTKMPFKEPWLDTLAQLSLWRLSIRMAYTRPENEDHG